MYTKVCEACGKEFTTNLKRVKYCSDECKKEGQKKSLDKYLEKKRSDRKARVAARTCVICGKPIDTKTRRLRYCSEACAEIGNQKNEQKYQEKLREQRKSLNVGKKARPKKSNLDKTIKEMVKYNKKYGKNLSYGEYSRLVGL